MGHTQEKLSQRLEELKAELKAGQQMEAELEAKLAQLRATLLRICGAIQVLEEMLDNNAAVPKPAAALPAHGERRAVGGEDGGASGAQVAPRS